MNEIIAIIMIAISFVVLLPFLAIIFPQIFQPLMPLRSSLLWIFEKPLSIAFGSIVIKGALIVVIIAILFLVSIGKI